MWLVRWIGAWLQVWVWVGRRKDVDWRGLGRRAAAGRRWDGRAAGRRGYGAYSSSMLAGGLVEMS